MRRSARGSQPFLPPWWPVASRLFAIWLFSLAGCATRVDVSTQESTQVRYGNYRTYHLVRHEVGRAEGTDAAIEQAIATGMSARGYVPIGLEGADLMVSYKLIVGGESAATTSLAPVTRRRPAPMLGGDWDGALHAEFVDDASVASTQRKALLVLLQEARSYRVIWMGWALSDVDPKEASVRALETIPRIMAKIPQRKLQQ